MRIAIGQPSSEPKVDQLESKLFTGVDEHHVLRLEVEVDDVRVVDKDQRLHDFHHKPGHSHTMELVGDGGMKDNCYPISSFEDEDILSHFIL